MEFFSCPYCGGENLHSTDDIAWEYRVVLRTFFATVTEIGRSHPRARPAG